MDIKKVDDKLMVIHTKKKTELHMVKKKEEAPRNKIKKVTSAKGSEAPVMRNYLKSPRIKQIRLNMKESKKSLSKKSGTINTNLKLVSQASANASLSQVDGGKEVKDATMVAYGMYQPVAGATRRTSEAYKKGLMRVKRQRIKQVEKGKKIAKRDIKKKFSDTATTTDTVMNTSIYSTKRDTKETSNIAAKKVNKGTAKSVVSKRARFTTNVTTKAKTQAGTTATIVAENYGNATLNTVSKDVTKRASQASDKASAKKNLRNRKIRFFLDRLRSEEKQKDSVASLAKDLVAGKLMAKLKASIAVFGAGLLLLLLLFTVVIVPVASVIAVIYNSPFAIFFPPLESGDTVITVTSSYVNEFNREINELIRDHEGCDMGMKVYVDYEGSESNPSNNYDIMAVYMVKYGVGDTATIMNSKSKGRLKDIVNDMCSYTTSTGDEEITDANGNVTTKSCYYVHVTLKTFQDMVDEYGFTDDEIAILEDMMSPESMAMLNSEGGDGLSTMTNDEIDEIVSKISDSKAKEVVGFALSKVGYPYSQEMRDSGDYYDCSSLAYYSWKEAGVDISFGGATTAAAEAEGLVNDNKEIAYEDMKPGDLIFYSFCHNGRYDNISHVAIYAGDNKVVEAKSEEYGVVYGSIYSVGNIVHICRPD